MKTILIWDIDNLPIKNKIEEVCSNLMFKPDEAYALSSNTKINMNNKTILKLKSYGIDYVKIEKRSDILEDFLKGKLAETDNYILISSDSKFCEFIKIATEQKKNIQQFLISNKKKRTLFTNDITADNVKYFFLEEKEKVAKKTKVVKTIEVIDYCQLSNAEVKKRMKSENIFYSKYAMEKYKEQKNKEQGIKYKAPTEKVKGASSKISLADLEELYEETSSLNRYFKKTSR